MTNQVTGQNRATAGRAATVQLAVKKGSRVIPLLLLVTMVVLFVSDHFSGLSGNTAGQIIASKLPNAEKAIELLKGGTAEFFHGFSNEFRAIVKGTLLTIGTLSLYALVPGLAGMIYRRSFWRYFLGGFLALYVIASVFSPKSKGVLGLVTGADAAAEGSGMQSIVFFIVSQLILLLLAFRLYRHTSSVSVLTPTIYNVLLAMTLGIVGIGCYFQVGPDGLWKALLPNTFYRWEFMLLMLPATYLLLQRRLAWSGKVPKNIVVCLDGTNAAPGQKEFGRIAQTNVLKLFDMLKQDPSQASVINALIPSKGQFDATLTKRYGEKQIAFYYSGVGNAIENSPILDGLGLATGLGADSIVDRAYLDIMRVYRPGTGKVPGDRIFIFGFSRGAAIARLLARTIDQKGAPRKLWSIRLFGRHWPIWKSDSKQHDVPIAVLGCWDTVGAFGVAKKIAGIDFGKVNAFKDLSIPDNVEQAYHLVALDELRDSFAPTLMDADPLTPERIVEVWFSGDHSNVGGSWATDKLSDVTLDFMLGKISSGYIASADGVPGNEDWGLYMTGVNGRRYTGPVTDDLVVLNPDPLGQLRQVTSMIYNYVPRKMPLHAVISDTVIERMTQSEPAYAPQSLFDLNDEIDAKRDAIDEKERMEIFKVKEKLRLTRWSQYWKNLSIATPLPEERLRNKTAAVSGAQIAADGGGVF